MKKHMFKELAGMIGDILFVLILCFAVLLTTMLLTKSSAAAVRKSYQINPAILAGVVVSIAGYLIFMLRQSLASLRKIIQHFFEEKEHWEVEKL